MEEIFTRAETIANEAANTIASPNWADQASVVISVISALISLAAVFVAGYVAWKQIGIASRQNEIALKQAEIADQQNKIALFEKRIFVYDEISKVMSVGKAVNKNAGVSIRWVFDAALVRLGYNFTIDMNHPKSTIANLVVIVRTTEYIKQAPFLFSLIAEHDADDLSIKFVKFFDEFVEKVLDNPDMTMDKYTSETKAAFVSTCKDFWKKYHTSMIQCLRLTR